METLLKQLIALLHEQGELLSEMITVASDKTHQLANSNVEEVNQIIKTELELNLRMDRIEKLRSNAVHEITAFFGMNDTSVTISEILRKIPQPYKTELQAQKTELSNKLDEYKRINELNFELIENGLNYVEFMINTVSGKQEPQVIYGAKGYKQQGENRQLFFDNKA